MVVGALRIREVEEEKRGRRRDAIAVNETGRTL